MSGHGPKHQSPAFRAHLRAYGLDRPMWVRLKNALGALEESEASIVKARVELSIESFSIVETAETLRLLVEGSRGEFKGGAR